MSDPLRLMEDESVRADVRRDLERFTRSKPAFDEDAGLLRLSAAIAALPAAGVIGASASTGLKAGVGKLAAWKIVLLCALGTGAVVTVGVYGAGSHGSATPKTDEMAERASSHASSAEASPAGQVSLSVVPAIDTSQLLAASTHRTGPSTARSSASVLATPAQGLLRDARALPANAPSSSKGPAMQEALDPAATTLQQLHEKAARAARERAAALDEEGRLK